MTTPDRQTNHYPDNDHADDPLFAQVAAREDEEIQRDPEAGSEPPTIRLSPAEDGGIRPVEQPR